MLRAVTLLAAALLADAVIPDWDGIAPPARPTRLVLHAGAIYLGTEAGLYRRAGGDGRGWSLVAAAEPIVDLAPAGAELLIATPTHLYSCTGACERPERIALGAGATPSGLAVDSLGTAWAATGSGLFQRRAGEREWRREPSLPAGAIDSVAAAGADVWAGANGELWQGGAGREFAQRVAGAAVGWWQLCGAAAFGDVTLLGVTGGLWRIDAAGARQIDLALGPIYRVERAGARVFVAADAGLYSYTLSGLGNGGGRQALSVAAFGLGVDSERLLVATERGLAAFALDASEPPPPPPRPSAPAVDHGARVALLRRAVLEYQQLEPERLAELEERTRWAGLYPEVRAAGSVDNNREWDGDHNTTFTTGAFHHLADIERDQKHDYGAAVTLVWELSDLVTPDHALDVSRERRLVVSLRDQVLERVNHLYFQRVQILAQRDALAPHETARRAELELAAAEIAAQLDAWSGGVFSRLEQSSPLVDQREP